MSAMSAKPAKRPLRSLTAHEKLVAIRRVHDGESKAAVARDIGVPESTLRGWCKNEEKISYISRQSSPDTDDSLQYEPKEKRTKRDDSNGAPFNLSMKASPRVSYSPNSEAYKQDDRPLNLNMKVDTQKTERDRNRAELARLSIELGLNRPEMYPTATGNPLDMNNINLLAQWNNLLLQQKPKTSQPDTSAGMSSQALLTTFNQEREKGLPKVDPPKSVEDSVWYWLKTQQAMLGLNQQNQSQSQNQNVANMAHSFLTTNAIVDPTNSSWFWKWYKDYTQLQSVAAQHQLQPQQAMDKILYQQLTKDNSENLTTTEEKPKSTNRARAVLDNLLLNNNNVAVIKKDSKEDDVSQMEALEHGEKFLKWLECCSEPSVTAMQIMQFRGLINNIKTGANRKNGDHQKTKVRRK
ncbi:PREDICTED: protein distal antenna [Nicrophorus vespilloides]|uniref:Protein distal antenna n=1 Tax=Nicrophorus vespilloides TaxID=110193 RepID=A0ABM1MYQ1_NICVS|nr:PREDICTED: protein distal antenna [Nicrophorus vespilloides]